MIKLANHFGRSGTHSDDEEDKALEAFCRVLGARVRAERGKRGLKIPELSERLGLSPTYVTRMESGARMPSVRVFLRICALLGLSPNELLGMRESGVPSGEIYDAARAELDRLNERELAAVAELLRAFRELCAKP